MDRLVMGYLERNNPTSPEDANRMILAYLKRYYAEASNPSTTRKRIIERNSSEIQKVIAAAKAKAAKRLNAGPA
jgi:hypothetical protein